MANKFEIEGIVSFYKKEELDILRVTNKYSQLDLSLYGAHILSFTPKGEKDVLWMSPTTELAEGKAIRGGIPLCFPWFGPHETDNSLPMHGFARISVWKLEEVIQQENEETFLRLSLKSSPETMKYWPFDFNAELTVVVGKNLEVNLTINNTGAKNFNYTSALHTYFGISNIEDITIKGLQDSSYYSGFAPELHKQSEELLAINQEENRRYINSEATCFINDKGFDREILADKKGSKVTVIWNPWTETCKKFEDVPDDGYKSFVCVEASNSYNDEITLQPGGQHTTSVILGIV